MTQINRRQALVSALALLASFPTPVVHAQAKYPERPIRGRALRGRRGRRCDHAASRPKNGAAAGSEARHRIETGASGNIGTLEVARAQPNGYTVLVGAMGNFVINQFLTKMSFDPLTALMPVAKVVDIPIVLFSNSSVPARNLSQFIAYAGANPGKLNYGSQGNGSLNHLLIERFKQVAGLEIIHIPYGGSPPAMLALLANQIQMFSAALVVGAAQVGEGRLTIFAVTTEKRLPALPDVPTMIEAGFPKLTILNWWGMAAPEGTPAPVIRTLNQAVTDALRDPLVVERFATLGMLVPTQTIEQFTANLKSEAALWSQVIQRGKIASE